MKKELLLLEINKMKEVFSDKTLSILQKKLILKHKLNVIKNNRQKNSEESNKKLISEFMKILE